MSGYITALGRTLFGGSQKEDTEVQETHASNASQHGHNNLRRDNSVEEISSQEARAPTGSKRRRDEEGAGAGGRSSKVRRPSDSAHLRPDYRYGHPADAVRLDGFGSGSSQRSERNDGYDLNKDWPSTNKPPIQRQTPAKSNMGVPKRGGVRPMNTLDNSSAQAARTQNGVKLANNFFTGYAPNGTDKVSRSDNTGRGKPLLSSGNPQQPDRNGLRSRMDRQPAQPAGLPGDPIVDLDLTEEELSHLGRPTSTSNTSNERKAGSSTQLSQTSAPAGKYKGERGDPLGGGEHRRVNAMFDGKVPPQAQSYPVHMEFKASAPPPSSRSAPPAEKPRPEPSSGTEQSPVAIVDDDDTSQVIEAREVSPPKRLRLDTVRPQAPQKTAQRVKSPKMDLAAGMDDYAQNRILNRQQRSEKPLQGSTQDLEGMKSTFDAHKPSAHRTSKDGRYRGHIKDLEAAQAPSSTLRAAFVRDDQPMPQEIKQPPALKTKMKDKMQGSRVDFDDIDELNGPPTVTAGKTSPEKRQTVARQPASKANSTAARRSASPSDIRPTDFTQSRRGSQQAMKHSAPSSEIAYDDDNPDEVRIPIKAIFCKAMMSNQKGLELLWNHELPGFLVICEGRLFYCDDDRTPVSIGQSALRKLELCKGDPRIVFKGSRNAISAANILVECEDVKGVHQCMLQLSSLVDDSLSYEYLKAGLFDRTYKNLVSKEHELYVRANKGPARSEARSAAPQATAQGRRNTRHPSEEILYEGDEQDASKTKLRSRIQGGNLSDVIEDAGYQQPRSRTHDGTTSRHFTEPRRSGRATRQVQPREPTPPSPPRRDVEKWTKTHNPKEWHYSVVYPSEGPRRVTIDFCDLPGLDEDECLNDNVVNFWLRYIEETMPAEHKDKVHFFNTFFYSSMTTKNGKQQLNYDAVKRWTKSVDLFAKSYVVVPMCVGFHWFVIIICNLPNIKREISGFDDAADGPGKDALEAAIPSDEAEPKDDSTAETRHQPDVYTFDEDGQANDVPTREIGEETARSSPQSAAAGKKARKKGPGMRTYEVDQPTLISMDSFGLPRAPEIKYLKKYLEKEANSKRAMELNHEDLQGVTAKALPQQANLTDCGLYMLAYIEQFCKDPEPFVRKVLQRDTSIQRDFAEFDPDRKREEIRKKLLDLQKAQYEQKVAQKKAKAAAKKGQTPPAAPESAATSVPAKQKTPTPAPPAKQTEQAPTEDPQPEQLKHETEPTPVSMNTNNQVETDEAEGLKVQEPRAIGQQMKSSLEKASPPPTVDDASNNDDDEEMLLDESADADSDDMDVDSTAAEKKSSEAQHASGSDQELARREEYQNGGQTLLDVLEQNVEQHRRETSSHDQKKSREGDNTAPAATDEDTPMGEAGNEPAVQEPPRKSKSPVVLVSKTEGKRNEEAAAESEIPESQSHQTGDLSF